MQFVTPVSMHVSTGSSTGAFLKYDYQKCVNCDFHFKIQGDLISNHRYS